MRIYAQANDGDIFHYRDKSGLEADMVVTGGQFACRRDDGVLIVPLGCLRN